jgi:hypothetical protein
MGNFSAPYGRLLETRSTIHDYCGQLEATSCSILVSLLLYFPSNRLDFPSQKKLSCHLSCNKRLSSIFCSSRLANPWLRVCIRHHKYAPITTNMLILLVTTTQIYIYYRHVHQLVQVKKLWAISRATLNAYPLASHVHHNPKAKDFPFLISSFFLNTRRHPWFGSIEPYD